MGILILEDKGSDILKGALPPFILFAQHANSSEGLQEIPVAHPTGRQC